MTSVTLIGYILEIIFKAVGIALSLLVFPVQFIISAFSKTGNPDEETRGVIAMIDGWFRKQVKPSEVELTSEVDVMPIVSNMVLDIIDRVHGTHIANAVYTDEEIKADIKKITDGVKDALLNVKEDTNVI